MDRHSQRRASDSRTPPWLGLCPPYAALPLEAGKTVRYVTLPDISEGAVMGSVAMHVFALAVG
ncbi:hypothetical protein [Streptomyces sp. JNUCC 63]